MGVLDSPRAWFLEGVDQMTMFDHDGGGEGVKISENLILTTWYMNGPLVTDHIFIALCIEVARVQSNEWYVYSAAKQSSL